ncbi:hypothetical protein C2R81_06325 [Helicobacter pylori]|nr:hypothetical protein C2R81_06325 [Helicobacter pylori]
MMCQFYLKQIDLLVNSEIVRYRYSNLFEPIQRSLWESIKTLDNESGIHLFPKNIGEIKDKFEANKEKFKQSKNVSEFAEYCRECNPYTAFNFHLNNGSSHQFDELVPTMKEYKEPKITDNDLKATLSTQPNVLIINQSYHQDWFFQNSLFRKMDFHPYDIWKILNLDDFNQRLLNDKSILQIMFDRNNDLEIYCDFKKSFNIPEKYLQERDQKEIKQSKYLSTEVKGEYNDNVCQFEFFKKDTSPLLFKISFTEILENFAEI